MLSCFAGGVLVAPLCGEPLLAAFADGAKVLIASLLWFLIYYTPHDLTYHVRILNAYLNFTYSMNMGCHRNSVQTKKFREIAHSKVQKRNGTNSAKK
jgi:hypothetical protein